MREAGQLALLVAVDLLYLRWPAARLPWADRVQTMHLLLGTNVVALFDLWLARALPRWTASRISSTWSRRERERFARGVR
jgi:hypothetical protein